jgi:hypothetical protein
LTTKKKGRSFLGRPFLFQRHSGIATVAMRIAVPLSELPSLT